MVGCCLVLGPSEHQLPDPRLKPELHPFLESRFIFGVYMLKLPTAGMKLSVGMRFIGGLLCDPLRPPKTELNIGASVEFLINGKTSVI